MNPLIRLLVLLAIGVGGAYFGMTSYQKLKVEDQHKLERARIDKEWLERANWVNAVPEVDKYREERDALDKWYFGQLTEHYNKFPLFRAAAYKSADEVAGAKKEGKKKDAGDAAVRAQYIDLTKKVFEELKAGTYRPVLTAYSNSLRLDIYHLGRVGNGKLRFDVVLWGAQRKMDRETTVTGTVSKMITAATFNSLNFKFIDEKGKVFGEMNVTGDPEIKVDYPERWIEEFPSQAVIGYYELDPLPTEPVKMQLEIAVNSRSGSGNDIPGNFKFEVPIESGWKLSPGEKWEGATTEERSKDYIEGKAQQ